MLITAELFLFSALHRPAWQVPLSWRKPLSSLTFRSAAFESGTTKRLVLLKKKK